MESSSTRLLFFSVLVALLGLIGALYGKSFILQIWKSEPDSLTFDLDWVIEEDRLDWATNCKKDRLFLPSCLQRCASFSNETVWSPKAEGILSITDLSCHACPYYKPFDTLFSYLELRVRSQGRSWGDLLDAGTGTSSLKWALKLNTASTITAVTVSEHMMQEVLSGVGEEGSRVNFVKGDWVDQGLLQGAVFDNILADYLVGAMDGFTPFIQDTIFDRLKQHLRDQSTRIFVVGMEPYPETAPSAAGKLMIEVARLRDACILLHRERPYREYPMEWIERTLRKSGMEIVQSQAFPVIYGTKKLIGQLNVCTQKFKITPDPALLELQSALKRRVEGLTREIKANAELQTGLCFGMDYVVEAKLP